MRLVLLGIFLVLASATAGSGFVRSPSIGGGIRTPAFEARPDLGIRAGAFMVYPRLNAGVEYNDNIYAVGRDTESDWITTFAPRIMAASTWSRHNLKLDAGVNKGFYLNNSRENFLDGHVLMGGRINLFQESYVEARAGYERYHEERGDPDIRYSWRRNVWPEPSRYSGLTGAGLLHYQAGRFLIDAGGKATGYVFDPVGLSDGRAQEQSYRDRVEYNAHAQVGYEWFPSVRPFVRAEYDLRRYDKKDQAQRDSEGYRIGAGTSIHMGGVTTGRVWVGYQRQNYDYDLRVDLSSIWCGVELTWEVTRLTKIRASLDRIVRETTYYTASGIDSTGVDVSLDHELLRNLSMLFSFSYLHDDYTGVDITDDYYVIRPGLTYRPHRKLTVDLGYEYITRNSSQVEALWEYTVNRAVVSLSGDF